MYLERYLLTFHVFFYKELYEKIIVSPELLPVRHKTQCNVKSGDCSGCGSESQLYISALTSGTNII